MHKFAYVYKLSDGPRMLGLAFVYSVLAKLVLTFSSANGNVTIFWIPGGLAVAALLIWGKRFWPAVFIGAVFAGIIVKDPLWVSLLLATGNTLETLAAVTMLQRITNFDLSLSKCQDFITVAWVGAISAIISALIGPFSLLASGYLTIETVGNNILHWWQADTLGILLGTPFVLAWRQWPFEWFKRQKILTTLVFFVLVFLTGQVVFLEWFHASLNQFAKLYWMFLLTIWGGWQFGRQGALLVIAATAVQALQGAVLGIGAFGSDIEETGLQNFWFFLLVLTLAGISLAISIDHLKVRDKKIHLLNQAYAALAETNRMDRHANNKQELFESACRIAVEIGGMKMAWIGLPQDNSSLIKPVASYGCHTDYLEGIGISVDPEIPEGLGPAGICMREGRVVVVQDFANTASTRVWQHRSQKTGNWHACASFPILRGNRPYAVFTIYHGEVNAFDDLNVDLLNAMSADIGFTLDFLDTEANRKLNEAELTRYKNNLEEQVQQRTADLIQALNAAKEANKAKSIFLANMSHELRTPLNAILGYSDMMRKNLRLDQSERDKLEVIHHSGERLLNLINDVLEMAQIEDGNGQIEATSFELDGIVRDVIDLMSVRAKEKSLQLRLEKSLLIPRFIKCDEDRLRQILINLIDNAIKFTEHGTVTIRLGVKQSITQQLLIEVEDTGPGISLTDQQRIFDSFVQLGEHAVNLGGGLGLSITRQFVQMMGGYINVESSLGKGCLFRVELPLTEATAPDIAGPVTKRGVVTGLAPGQSEYRILIVENKTENRQVLARLLEGLGFQIQMAESGKLAVQLFQNWQPHLILINESMPEMDGLEIASVIRNLPGGEGVKIVSVSSSDFNDRHNKMLNAEVDDFVSEPFQFNEIYECLTRQLGMQFTYADASPAETVGAGKLNAEMLSVLPPEFRCELGNALESLEEKRIRNVVQQVAAYDLELHNILALMVGNFEYPRILKALQTD